MPEPLKNQFGPEIPKKIAAMVQTVAPKFFGDQFVAETLRGFDTLELMPRARKIAATLHQFLPPHYPEAIKILVASLGPKLGTDGQWGMSPFIYLPHVFFVGTYGLDHFDESMAAQYEITQRFTAEYSIRPFLMRYQDEALAVLAKWARDDSVHVRRLVSEGTRPRLPWAPRLPHFQKDPAAVIALLELLKDDPELYVRRSVANNLNDIGKDNPEILFSICKAWGGETGKHRTWIIRHALRSAVKRAEPGALKVLGYGARPEVLVEKIKITPQRARVGGRVVVSFELKNSGKKLQNLLVDLRVHFVKASGKTAPKVFKLKEISLAPQEQAAMSKTISLQKMTTRTIYPGKHRLDILINGQIFDLGNFVLIA